MKALPLQNSLEASILKKVLVRKKVVVCARFEVEQIQDGGE
jgi:hypothetical protein